MVRRDNNTIAHNVPGSRIVGHAVPWIHKNFVGVPIILLYVKIDIIQIDTSAVTAGTSEGPFLRNQSAVRRRASATSYLGLKPKSREAESEL